MKECWSKAQSRPKAPSPTHIEELPCGDDRFKGAGGNSRVCRCWKDFKRRRGIQEVLLDNASIVGSQCVGGSRCELKREGDSLVRRSIFREEHFTRNAGLNLGSTREGNQASGRNGKATTLNVVEIGVDWCAKVVMKEEREMNCGASNCRGRRSERGERSKQTRLDGKGSG